MSWPTYCSATAGHSSGPPRCKRSPSHRSLAARGPAEVPVLAGYVVEVTPPLVVRHALPTLAGVLRKILVPLAPLTIGSGFVAPLVALVHAVKFDATRAFAAEEAVEVAIVEASAAIAAREIPV